MSNDNFICVTTYTVDGEKFTNTAATPDRAMLLCEQEMEWDSTIRVVCEAIGFDKTKPQN